jgi:peptide/nickel transport system permease protein
MDGMMAIPAIMLAIALHRVVRRRASCHRPSSAVTLPEVPRVVRLVRSVVLTLREQPYIEAATAIGTSVPRHPAAGISCPTRCRRSVVQATVHLRLRGA